LAVSSPLTMHCIQHSIWDPYKNGWTDRDAVWDNEWAWPEEQCVTWAWRSPNGKGAIMGKTCPTTPPWVANWTDPCSGVHMIGADAWLQALDESIIGREGGVGLHTVGEVWYLRLPCFSWWLTGQISTVTASVSVCVGCVTAKRRDVIQHTGLTRSVISANCNCN